MIIDQASPFGSLWVKANHSSSKRTWQADMLSRFHVRQWKLKKLEKWWDKPRHFSTHWIPQSITVDLVASLTMQIRGRYNECYQTKRMPLSPPLYIIHKANTGSLKYTQSNLHPENSRCVAYKVYSSNFSPNSTTQPFRILCRIAKIGQNGSIWTLQNIH